MPQLVDEAQPARRTLREAVLEGIAEEMSRDERVVVIGQDIGAFRGPLRSTDGLAERFGPDRVIETPICEGSMTSMAVGAALAGLRPIVEIMFSDLLPVATTALVQVAANFRYLSGGAARVPIVVRTRGGDGPYRAHPQNYEALFCHSPGLVVVAPSNAADAKGLIKSAIRADDPVLFIENIFLYNAPKEPLPDGADLVPLGRARVARAGRDVTVVAYGRAVRSSLAAADELSREGVEVEVVDLRTLRPIDEEAILSSVVRTRRLVTVHEAWTSGGLGAEVLARVTEEAFPALRAAPVRLGAPPVAVPWAEPLRDQLLPTAARIRAAIRTVVDGPAR